MKRLGASAAALALAAVALVGTASPSSATTEHCADYKSPDKVELDYETTTLHFRPYTTVCYKAGTEVRTVVVGDTGVLKSDVYNKFGKRMAISYYIRVPYCPPTGS
jgi:hypothetical protein